MILVLLSRFCQSEDTLGFQLCQTLAQQGHHLYVTTTSSTEALHKEIKSAADISIRSKGSVTLFQPENTNNGAPNDEWITTSHAEYFSYLSELDDIQTVIGMLPGTEQTAAEIKDVLNCKMVLVSSTKIEVNIKHDRKYFGEVASKTDEFWCVGPDMFSYYMDMFRNINLEFCRKLREILLQPLITIPKEDAVELRNHRREFLFVSSWNNSFPFFQFRKQVNSKKSKLDDFASLNSALGHVGNIVGQTTRIRWNIHDISRIEIEKLKQLSKPNLLEPEGCGHLTIEQMTHNKDIIYTAPDIKDERFNFHALTAMWLGIPTLVSSQSSVGKLLLQLNCSVTHKAIVDLVGDTVADTKTWIEKLRALWEQENPTQWAKELSEYLHKNQHLWTINPPQLLPTTSCHRILVLLYKFTEAQESLLGSQLCQTLVREGHDLLVTTTSTAAWLKSEREKAKVLTEKFPGSITIIEPIYRDYEYPSVEWIANLSRHYFGDLYKLKNINMIIGTLPGTSQTAVDLKQALECKLVLLGTTKIGAGEEELKTEINIIAQKADEIWSVGSDTYMHYQRIFQEVNTRSSDIHKTIRLKPYISSASYVTGKKSGRKLVSVWNSPIPFFHKGKMLKTEGSDIHSFYSLCSALGVINIELLRRHMNKIQWNVHGLKFQDSIIRAIETSAKPHEFKLNPLSKVSSVDDSAWKNSLAFIVPDVVDESFNFLALCAMWLGVPTLVSSQSSVGRLVLSLNCPERDRAVVTLTGNHATDREAWTRKIYSEIFAHDANPTQWARGLSSCLQESSHLWELDLSIFTRQRRLSVASNVSFFTALEDQPAMTDIIDKVTNWQHSNEEARSKHSEPYSPWGIPQVMSKTAFLICH